MAAATKIGITSPRHQRGVAAIFAAFALLALLTAVGIAIDLSRFYFSQRDLQRMTNAAALDAARVAGGCLGIPADPQAAALTEVNQSVLRNGGQADYVTRGSVLVGRMLKNDAGVRSFSPGAADENRAVQVILRRPAPGRLIPLPGMNDGNVTLTATAAAQSRPMVSISVGSSAASISQGLLGALLTGGPANALNIVSYQGLIAETASLGQLANGVPVDQFLGTSIPVSSLLTNLLNAVGGTTAGVTEPLTQAITAFSGSGATVVPGNVIGVPDSSQGAVDDARISAGQLLLAVSQSAVNNSIIHIPVTLPLGSLANIFLDARLIQPSQPVVIPAGVLPSAGDSDSFAHNSQGLVQLSATLLGGTVNLNLFVKAAYATASLKDIRCARRGQPTHQIQVAAHTDLAGIGIGKFDDINAPNPQPQPIKLITLPAIPLLLPSVSVSAYGIVQVGQPNDVDLDFSGPPFPTATQRIDVTASDITSSLADLVSHTQIQFTPCVPSNVPNNKLCLAVEGLPAGLTTPLSLVTSLVQTALVPVLSAVTSALAPSVNNLVTPLLNLLGLSLGTADVTVEDVTNDQPYLFINSR